MELNYRRPTGGKSFVEKVRLAGPSAWLVFGEEETREEVYAISCKSWFFSEL